MVSLECSRVLANNCYPCNHSLMVMWLWVKGVQPYGQACRLLMSVKPRQKDDRAARVEHWYRVLVRSFCANFQPGRLAATLSSHTAAETWNQSECHLKRRVVLQDPPMSSGREGTLQAELCSPDEILHQLSGLPKFVRYGFYPLQLVRSGFCPSTVCQGGARVMLRPNLSAESIA